MTLNLYVSLLNRKSEENLLKNLSKRDKSKKHIIIANKCDLTEEGKVTGVVLENVKTGERETVACDGVFVSIGRQPATELFKGQIELDEAGYVVADETTKTNIPGVFAIGDVRQKALRQVVTAVADGAVASYYADEYLAEQE